MRKKNRVENKYMYIFYVVLAKFGLHCCQQLINIIVKIIYRVFHVELKNYLAKNKKIKTWNFPYFLTEKKKKKIFRVLFFTCSLITLIIISLFRLQFFRIKFYFLNFLKEKKSCRLRGFKNCLKIFRDCWGGWWEFRITSI